MLLVDQNTNNSVHLAQTFDRILLYTPDIICLQEFYYDKFRKVNNRALKGYKLITPKNKNFRVNAFLSKYDPIKYGEIYFSGIDLKKSRNDNYLQKSSILWADFKIGKIILRIYNCHLYVHKIGFLERAIIIEKIISHTDPNRPTLILGDMNTTIPDRGYQRFLNYIVHWSPSPKFSEVGKFYTMNEKYFFNYRINKLGFNEALDININTWRLPNTPFEFFCRLKLDWLLYRNISKPKAKILEDTPLYLDHKTIVATVNL